jgi:hypothetical protein
LVILIETSLVKQPASISAWGKYFSLLEGKSFNKILSGLNCDQAVCLKAEQK